MSILTIKINSVCDTSPPRPHIDPKRLKQLRWRSGSHDFYVLHLPGGFFKGYPVDFLLPVPTTGYTATLELVNLPADVAIKNYVYDTSGQHCVNPSTAAPPDIIIDSTP